MRAIVKLCGAAVVLMFVPYLIRAGFEDYTTVRDFHSIIGNEATEGIVETAEFAVQKNMQLSRFTRGEIVLVSSGKKMVYGIVLDDSTAMLGKYEVMKQDHDNPNYRRTRTLDEIKIGKLPNAPVFDIPE